MANNPITFEEKRARLLARREALTRLRDQKNKQLEANAKALKALELTELDNELKSLNLSLPEALARLKSPNQEVTHGD